MLKKAVFLDRDGVLNQDLGYVHKIRDIKWIDGAIDTIKLFNKLNYLVFVVTNQSGVARNYYSEDDVIKLHLWMKDFLKKNGAVVNQFSYCPHYPLAKIEKYRKDCFCRKPNPGMIVKLINSWQIDKKVSFLIGDKISDVEAANTAGIQGYKFNCENLFKYTKDIMDL